MKISIQGYSTALFSSWYFIEELGILFDAGDGVVAKLLQKSRKIKQVFITHPDRDHITGLFQLLQLNAFDGHLKVYYPKDSGSFPAMQAFINKFDPHVSACEWVPMDEGTIIPIKKDIFVRSFRNKHIDKGDFTKSISFEVFREKQKLKDEFIELSGKEIQALKAEKGIEALTYLQKENILYYSGDTPVYDYSMWAGAKILIHESTFMTREDLVIKQGGKQRNRHSALEEVMEMAAELQPEVLILGHFSSRYSATEIEAAVLAQKAKHGLDISVHVVLPGGYIDLVLEG